MSGMGAYVLIKIGAFIRWFFKGFKGSYKLLAEGNGTDTMKNDIKNILITLASFFIVMSIIQLLFF